MGESGRYSWPWGRRAGRTAAVLRAIGACSGKGVDDAGAAAAVHRVHRAFETAFTDAVALLFRIGIGLLVAAIAITALMPSVELRHGHAPRDAGAGASRH